MINKFPIRLALFLGLFSIVSCNDDDTEVLTHCHKGTIIGKIRSAGGGPALAVNSSHFGKQEWKGYENVVEALNLQQNYPPGTKIYFNARPASIVESSYIVTADGDESAKPKVWITEVSTVACPAGINLA